uniref:Sodium-dependent multivitamin transporter n=1 Tax=Buteo japonicus TaxID=224669 RepID=A0A8C0AVZ9_9AVES
PSLGSTMPSASPSASMASFTVWDYVVFAAMLLVSAVIGVYYAFVGGGQKSSKDFLMGGRSMTALPVALSLTASFMSAVTVLGTPAEIYRYGAIFCIFAITYGLVVLCSAEIFLPVFYKLGITSTYEYLELRFNKYLRLCGTILFIVQTASKPQSCSAVLVAITVLQLSVTTVFSEWLMRLPQCTGGWEWEQQSSFRSKAMRWGVDAGLPAPGVSVFIVEHPEQSLGISHAKRRATLHCRVAVQRAVVRLPAEETHNGFKM